MDQNAQTANASKKPKSAKHFLIISIVVIISLAIIGYIVTSLIQNANNATLPVKDGTGQEGKTNSTLDLPE